ncbi:hypothetical protein [Burkholderia sp. TSV86]|uniref:hypothetical protein n=1 Tax=Burkholderia sp. TSV86 TaxID=1385594 RepID=UPI000754AA13|nr:hypothetical protein [Burkholderia sp. TSV86]KVE39251.1 hypothetical protein WS68_20880 [Burkholderia sp. TSV86]
MAYLKSSVRLLSRDVIRGNYMSTAVNLYSPSAQLFLSVQGDDAGGFLPIFSTQASIWRIDNFPASANDIGPDFISIIRFLDSVSGRSFNLFADVSMLQTTGSASLGLSESSAVVFRIAGIAIDGNRSIGLSGVDNVLIGPGTFETKPLPIDPSPILTRTGGIAPWIVSYAPL